MDAGFQDRSALDEANEKLMGGQEFFVCREGGFRVAAVCGRAKRFRTGGNSCQLGIAELMP